MQCHPARWVWGLIPIAILSWFAVHLEADRIEHDLEQRARAALAAAGYDWASIVFSGRDGMLVGTPTHRHEQAEALALVRKVWGVRVVSLRASPLGEPAVAGIARERGPQSNSARALKRPDVVLPEVRPATVAAAAPSVLAERHPEPAEPVRTYEPAAQPEAPLIARVEAGGAGRDRHGRAQGR